MSYDALTGVNTAIDRLRSQLDIYMRFLAPKCLIDKETESVQARERSLINAPPCLLR